MYWGFCKDDQQDKWMYKPLFWIRDILERIQIAEPNNGLMDPDPVLFAKYIQDANKKYLIFLSLFVLLFEGTGTFT
jgi:hypothetical protein